MPTSLMESPSPQQLTVPMRGLRLGGRGPHNPVEAWRREVAHGQAPLQLRSPGPRFRNGTGPIEGVEAPRPPRLRAPSLEAVQRAGRQLQAMTGTAAPGLGEAVATTADVLAQQRGCPAAASISTPGRLLSIDGHGAPRLAPAVVLSPGPPAYSFEDLFSSARAPNAGDDDGHAEQDRPSRVDVRAVWHDFWRSPEAGAPFGTPLPPYPACEQTPPALMADVLAPFITPPPRGRAGRD